MKKKKTIIFMILAISIFVLLVIFNFEKIKGFLYLNCIPYDMEIFYHSPETAGGYASITNYYRINTKKKKEYSIKNYYVFGVTTRLGEKGPHYSLEVKKLTDEQINKLKEYAYGESTYTYSSSNSPLDIFNNRDFYVTIEYDGQIKNYNMSDFKY